MWSTHYAVRSGTSDNGERCGAFFVIDNNAASLARWSISAAL